MTAANGVAGQQQRLAPVRRGRGQPGDQVRLARRRRRDDLDLEAERLELRAQVLGDRRLVPRRVGGVEPDQVLEDRDRLAVLRARLRGARTQERDCARGDREPTTMLHGASHPIPSPQPGMSTRL